MRPGARAATAFTFGLLAIVNGGRHAHHVIYEGTTANDVTGVIALAAGVVLVGLAAWIPFRHRGERTASPVKRWAIRAAVIPASLLAGFFLYLPVGIGIVDIHSLRKPVGSPPSADYETVRLTTSDGIHLKAWYRPSRNGAAVLMLSGGGGDIGGTVRHAQLLARHGYGVLLFGGRGTGDSGGTVNSYGWGREKDAAAALDYLATRRDVQPGHVGALGLSTGADMAIDIAARRDDVKAVVADGTAAIGYEDIKEYTRRPGDSPERVGPVQGAGDHPGALRAGRLARRPDRPWPRCAPADRGGIDREVVGRALPTRRRRPDAGLVSAACGPHARAAPVPARIRAARGRLLRRSARPAGTVAVMIYEAPSPPLIVASASLHQQGTELRLKVRTRAPSRALCLRVQYRRTRIALCVGGSDQRLSLRRVVHGRSAHVAGTVKQHGTRITAAFTPVNAGIPFGRFRWSVQGAASTRMRSGRARLLAEPRCFGAAAAECSNPALRAMVTPSPEAALLIPGSPCVIFGATPVLLPCYFGVAVNRARERVALLGDSHAEHWRAALDVVAQAKRWRAVSLTRSGCPLDTAEAQLAPASRTDDCRQWNREVVAWLERHPEIHTVFVSAHAAAQFARDPVAGYRAAWQSLPASVRRIYVLRETPQRVHVETVSCVEQLRRAHEPIGTRCAEPRALALPPDPEAEAAQDPGDDRVRLLDLTDFMCTPSLCPPVIGGALVLKDGDHLTRSFSATLGPYVLRALR